jgi:CHAT domain-containing protein
VAPNITSLFRAQSAPTDAARSLLSVGTGAAVPEMQFKQLPNAEHEARAVAAKYSASLTLTGDNATRAAVMREIPRFSVVHFAGHAYADAAFPTRSFIALAGRDRLTADDLATVQLQPGTLATLAACETALGGSYRGEGPMSLVRSVLRAGAFGAVATLWQVRDDDSAALFGELHARLARGGTVPESLATVQRKFIAAGWPPSRWAGFESFSGMSLSGGY